MKLQEKIKSGNQLLVYPDDLLEFVSSPTFETDRNIIIDKYSFNIVDVDDYTDSVVAYNLDFKTPFDYLKPLIDEYRFTELLIKSFDDNIKPGSLSALPIIKVVVDAGVKKIPDDIFQDMKSLRDVVLMNGLESIGDEAFVGCRFLRNLSIPASVTNIGNNICGNCIFLESIKVEEGNKVYGSFDCNVIAKKNDMEIIQGCYKSTLNADFKSIGYRAFWKLPLLQEIKLPPSLEKISYEAFLGCVGVNKINLPNSLKTIEKGAFAFLNPQEVYFDGTIEEYSLVTGDVIFDLVKCTDGIYK